MHATPSLELDKFLIFNNNRDEANRFFKRLILEHVNNVLKQQKKESFTNADEFVASAFTQ